MIFGGLTIPKRTRSIPRPARRCSRWVSGKGLRICKNAGLAAFARLLADVCFRNNQEIKTRIIKSIQWFEELQKAASGKKKEIVSGQGLVLARDFWSWRGGRTGMVGLFSPALEVKEITVAVAKNVNSGDCVKLIQDEVNKRLRCWTRKAYCFSILTRRGWISWRVFPRSGISRSSANFRRRSTRQSKNAKASPFSTADRKSFLSINNGIAFEETGGSQNLLEISDDHEQDLKSGGQALPKDLLSGILRMAGG